VHITNKSTQIFIKNSNNISTVKLCDKARGHASNNFNLTLGTAHGDRKRNWPSVYKTWSLTLGLWSKFLQYWPYFHQITLFLEKNRPQSQGQISKSKNLNKISKLHAHKKVFFQGGGGGGQPLNYLMHGPGYIARVYGMITGITISGKFIPKIYA
jgi:hypothetical protein